MSSLTAIADLEGLLSDRELVAMTVLITVAGTETTASLIATTLWALLRHPDALARVRRAPWRLAAAIEEAARWESPVQRTWRIAREDVQLGGHRIRKGALVVALLGAANRDPVRFPDPDRFDPERRPAGHLAFGAGAHTCLGAALARLETSMAMWTLLRRSRDLRLVTDVPSWRPTTTLRGLATLPVLGGHPRRGRRPRPAARAPMATELDDKSREESRGSPPGRLRRDREREKDRDGDARVLRASCA